MKLIYEYDGKNAYIIKAYGDLTHKAMVINHTHYGADDFPDEGLAIIYYLDDRSSVVFLFIGDMSTHIVIDGTCYNVIGCERTMGDGGSEVTIYSLEEYRP